MKRKALSALLVLALALGCCAGLAGCGGGDEAKKLVGSWQAGINMADEINGEFDDDPIMAEHLHVDDFNLKMNFDFREDGTYTLAIDSDSMTAALAGVKETLRTGLDGYFKEVLAQEGLGDLEGMDLDQVLGSLGVNIDDMLDELLSEEDFAALAEDSAQEGKYMVKGGKIYLSDDVNEAADDNCGYYAYTLSGSELQLTDSSMESDEDLADYFPLVFQKQ